MKCVSTITILAVLFLIKFTWSHNVQIFYNGAAVSLHEIQLNIAQSQQGDVEPGYSMQLASLKSIAIYKIWKLIPQHFLVFQTVDNMWCSLEKKPEGIILQKAISKEEVVRYGYSKLKRGYNVTVVKEDCDTSYKTILDVILSVIETDNFIFHGYDLQFNYCKTFSNGHVLCENDKHLYGQGKTNIWNVKVSTIAIYKCPLEGLYSKSPKVVSDAVARQWTSVDYHAFVVLQTNDGMWASLDKNMEGVFIEWGQSRESIVNEFQSFPRIIPVELDKEDEAKYDLADLYSILEHSTSGYSAIHGCCKHFSRDVFNKVALSENWDFTTAAEFVSPITFVEFLLSNRKIVFFTVFVIVLTVLLKSCWVSSWDNFRKDTENVACLELEDSSELEQDDSELDNRELEGDSVDEDLDRLVQQNRMLWRHALNCKQNEQMNGEMQPCKIKNCSMMKESIECMKRCNDGNPGDGNPGDGNPGDGNQDHCRLIQRHLVLLLHAHKCQTNGGTQPCRIQNCSTIKEVLAHMTQCNLGYACTVSHCASSREIIMHWRNCPRLDCPVCHPLRDTNSHMLMDEQHVLRLMSI